jgi:hypothetical protein
MGQVEAEKVISFKSKLTGELFETEEALRVHDREVKKQTRLIESRAMKDAEIVRLSNRPRLEATSLDHLAELLVECHSSIVKLVNGSSYTGLHCQRFTPVERVVFRAKLCDVEGGFCSKAKPVEVIDQPTNLFYNGNINCFFARRPLWEDMTFRMLFNYIHTGTGGGDSCASGYMTHNELVLCLDDFPLLREAYIKQRDLEAKEREGEEAIRLAAVHIVAADPNYVALQVKHEVVGEEIAALRAQVSAMEKHSASIQNDMDEISGEARAQARLHNPNHAKAERQSLRERIALKP